MKRIKVTGILYIEDHEYDDGPSGPLTEDAFTAAWRAIHLDDIEFKLDDDG